MNPIQPADSAHYLKMIYQINKVLNSKDEKAYKAAKKSLKSLSPAETKALSAACIKMYGEKSIPLKTDRMSTPKTKLNILTKNIANLKTDEIFKGIFDQFAHEWKKTRPTHETLKSFIEQNKEIISIASIKNPLLWMKLSDQIRHKSTCPMSLKLQLLMCDNKLLDLINKKNFFLDIKTLPDDLKNFTFNQIPYKTIQELSNIISMASFSFDFKNVEDFCNWIDKQNIPIQWLLFLSKENQLPYPSESCLPLLKSLHLGLHLQANKKDLGKEYEALAEATKTMKNVSEFTFNIAEGNNKTENFLRPFGKRQGNQLKKVHFYTLNWWVKDKRAPFENTRFGSREAIENIKKGNDIYKSFLLKLDNVEVFSMKDYPMGSSIIEALPLSLKRLSISNCALNDEEILLLKRFTQLKRLDLELCPNVTALGTKALKLELPDLQIVYPR